MASAAVAALQPASIGSLLERSGTTTYVLGVIYLLTLLYCIRRFAMVATARADGDAASRRWPCTRWTWDIPRLFLASILFALLVRTMSFLTLAILALENVNIEADASGGGGGSGGGAQGNTADQSFYQRVLTVLVRDRPPRPPHARFPASPRCRRCVARSSIRATGPPSPPTSSWW